MKKILIVFVALFIINFGCKKIDENNGGGICACSPTKYPDLTLVVKNAAGALLTLTSVAYDANVQGWTLTLDATDPDYTAGAPVQVSLAGPTDLSVLLVKGYESNTITVTV